MNLKSKSETQYIGDGNPTFMQSDHVLKYSSYICCFSSHSQHLRSLSSPVVNYLPLRHFNTWLFCHFPVTALQALLHLTPLALQFCPFILRFVRKPLCPFACQCPTLSLLQFLILQLHLKAVLLVSSLCISPHTHFML